jgi:predicted PurR-regulated permease PerM
MTEDRPAPGLHARPALDGPPAAAPSRVPWLLVVGVVAGVGYLARGLLVPILLAIILTYMLNPVVAWGQGYGLRRSVVAGALFAAFGLLVLALVAFVAPRFRAEAVALVDNLPALTRTLERGIDGAARELAQSYPATRRFLDKPREPGWLERWIETRTENAGDLVGHAGAVAFAVVLAPVFAFFMLRDAGGLVTSLTDRLHPKHIETTMAVWCEIDRIIGQYLRGLALDAVVVGVLATVGLWLVGAPYPLLLGALTTLVNPLPYLGTVLSVGVAAIVAIANGKGLGTVGAIIALYLVIRILDDLVVVAVTIGGSVHMHPMLVLVSIIAGEQTLGLVGMVLAVPVVTVIKEIARLLIEHRQTLARPHVPPPSRASRISAYVC